MKTIIEMAREAGIDWHKHWDDEGNRLELFAALVRADEREACAKVADEYANGLERNYSEIIADLIRARGNT